jgi:hypothetical protein
MPIEPLSDHQPRCNFSHEDWNFVIGDEELSDNGILEPNFPSVLIKKFEIPSKHLKHWDDNDMEN